VLILVCANDFRLDDEIFDSFAQHFPDYLENGAEKLRQLSEDEIKSAQGKKRWREFMLPFEKKVGQFAHPTTFSHSVCGVLEILMN